MGEDLVGLLQLPLRLLQVFRIDDKAHHMSFPHRLADEVIPLGHLVGGHQQQAAPAIAAQLVQHLTAGLSRIAAHRQIDPDPPSVLSVIRRLGGHGGRRGDRGRAVIPTLPSHRAIVVLELDKVGGGGRALEGGVVQGHVVGADADIGVALVPELDIAVNILHAKIGAGGAGRNVDLAVADDGGGGLPLAVRDIVVGEAGPQIEGQVFGLCVVEGEGVLHLVLSTIDDAQADAAVLVGIQHEIGEVDGAAHIDGHGAVTEGDGRVVEGQEDDVGVPLLPGGIALDENHQQRGGAQPGQEPFPHGPSLLCFDEIASIISQHRVQGKPPPLSRQAGYAIIMVLIKPSGTVFLMVSKENPKLSLGGAGYNWVSIRGEGEAHVSDGGAGPADQ